MEENNQLETEFLENLDKPTVDVLEAPLTETSTEEKTEEEKEEEGFKAKNRRERRLLQQNQQLREESIATNARLEGIKEAEKLRGTTEEADYLKLVEPIYGNDDAGKAEATRLLKQALKGVYETAKREAKEETLQEIDQRTITESQAVAKEEETLDEMLDNMGDEFDVDFDSNESSRKGFLTLLENISPKDKDGNIVEYADPYKTFELFQKLNEKPNSRAKDLASRSMTRSGGQPTTKLEDDATVRFLKENGIL